MKWALLAGKSVKVPLQEYTNLMLAGTMYQTCSPEVLDAVHAKVEDLQGKEVDVKLGTGEYISLLLSAIWDSLPGIRRKPAAEAVSEEEKEKAKESKFVNAVLDQVRSASKTRE